MEKTQEQRRKSCASRPENTCWNSNKEGFNAGKFPLEIGQDDASGGSVSYELGTLAHDTVELRDGSVLVCDVESMSATDIVVRVGGDLERLDRNKVKRMLLVERDPPSR
jgi:hypothetical protein